MQSSSAKCSEINSTTNIQRSNEMDTTKFFFLIFLLVNLEIITEQTSIYLIELLFFIILTLFL